jgi:hypothetical protein
MSVCTDTGIYTHNALICSCGSMRGKLRAKHSNLTTIRFVSPDMSILLLAHPLRLISFTMRINHSSTLSLVYMHSLTTCNCLSYHS